MFGPTIQKCIVKNWMNCWKAKGSLPMPISSQATNHFVEGSETTGGKMGFLNNQN